MPRFRARNRRRADDVDKWIFVHIPSTTRRRASLRPHWPKTMWSKAVLWCTDGHGHLFDKPSGTRRRYDRS
ncbi:hypothetical protein BIFBIF_00570 [Bifidobacterium bifidum ATCC 29521 = JCM 1255 = DSM 20456]|nr:hypothetical protein BIFBIF_00570 [Bifidobacterium bifidum ATCC 29521 = JCM 1255 = DSM 20456]